jgi:hypothetical protein
LRRVSAAFFAGSAPSAGSVPFDAGVVGTETVVLGADVLAAEVVALLD